MKIPVGSTIGNVWVGRKSREVCEVFRVVRKALQSGYPGVAGQRTRFLSAWITGACFRCFVGLPRWPGRIRISARFGPCSSMTEGTRLDCSRVRLEVESCRSEVETL
jgi:hypothetical protein